jgi:Delta7-sterol 5-desaturase
MPRTKSSSSSKKRSSSSSSKKEKSVVVKKTVVLRESAIPLDPLYGRFPPQPDADGYYRYRQGRISRTNKSLNTFVLLPLVFFAFGQGMFINLLVLVINYGLGFLNLNNPHSPTSASSSPVDFTNKFHTAGVLSFGMIFTAISYYCGCRYVERQFYDSEESRAKAEEWKCRPYQWLTPQLRQKEIFWGCLNAAIGSFCGMSIFVYQQLPSTPPGTVKIYYEMNDPMYAKYGTQILGGWPYYFASIVVYFIASDFWAFWAHKTLHLPFAYRHIHRLHHSFRAVSPFGAYALHPLEFLFIMSFFQLFVFLMPIHFSALMLNLVYLGYHAILDHSGIQYDGWFSFSPSTSYHDDHHEHFHVNYGQSLVIWDWLWGTLRHKKHRYGEDVFFNTN